MVINNDDETLAIENVLRFCRRLLLRGFIGHKWPCFNKMNIVANIFPLVIYINPPSFKIYKSVFVYDTLLYS